MIYVLAVTYDEILGWANVLLDTFQLKPFIVVIGFILVAWFVYERFIAK